MVGGAAGVAEPPALHALLDLRIGDLQRQYLVKGDARLFQGFRLGDGTGHSVQNIAVPAVALSYPLRHDADDHIVRDQLARIHIALGLESHGRAVLHGRPEDVSS